MGGGFDRYGCGCRNPVPAAHRTRFGGVTGFNGLPDMDVASALKSSYKTGKKPRLDRTTTDQDRKTSRPVRTVTAVRSSVHPFSKNLKTDEMTGFFHLNIASYFGIFFFTGIFLRLLLEQL